MMCLLCQIINHQFRLKIDLLHQIIAMMSQRRASSTTMLLIFVVAFVSQCKGEGYPPASNCARLECPPYTVAHSEKEFEIRSYKDALWVSAPPVPSKSYKPAADKGFITYVIQSFSPSFLLLYNMFC